MRRICHRCALTDVCWNLYVPAVPMTKRVLHVLSQRPDFTGSGVSLQAIVRCAADAGWAQHVVVSTPAEDPTPGVADLPAEQVHPLVFGRGQLDFPLPGMSDVMPYASSRWSNLSAAQLDTYRNAWREHLTRVLDIAQPDVIHTRHIWLLSAMMKDVAPGVPVVNHCHATGLRQMELCPHLAEVVQRGCARNDRFFVLHRQHADALAEKLEVAGNRIHIIGTGYREELFHASDRSASTGTQLLYAGKYSHAKGLPQLLDAFERLLATRGDLTLHIAGDGAGEEAEALRTRMAGMTPRVVRHGQLDHRALADLMRRCDVFVLPSLYEGLPLVLVEALACGCRVVCSDLPGVQSGLSPYLGDLLNLVPLPRLIGPDVPVPEDVPAFVSALTSTLDDVLDDVGSSPQPESPPVALKNFTWPAVFERVEAVWQTLAQ